MRLPALLLLLLPSSAHAVIVRGTVTGPFGQPLPGARIQLISLSQGPRSMADSVSGVDGTYEIRTDLSGRFLLLTSSNRYAPQIGTDFYAGRTDLVTRNVALDPSSLTPLLTTTVDGVETPVSQVSTLLTQIAADRLRTRAVIPDDLPLAPATVLVQTGQQGQPGALYLGGANPEANAILIDGMQAQNVGGRFHFGSFSATGLSGVSPGPAIELLSGPNPPDAPAAEGGVVAFASLRGSDIHPTLDYSGDGGNLHTWRDEAAVALARRRADVFAAFSRFDTSNALPDDRFHNATAALNLGYNIAANTSLRLTARNEDAAVPLPIPYDLGLIPQTRDAEQNLYGSFTFETRTSRDWHNLLRYGLVRKREEVFTYMQPLGRIVTLRGANGTVVTGQATFPELPAREDSASNRDAITYQSDSPLIRNPAHPLNGVLTFRYQDERGLDAAPATSANAAFNERLDRTNVTFAAALKGQFRQRLFAEVSGEVNHATRIGLTGAPRLGLTYVPVNAGRRRLRGTVLHLTVAAGSRELSLEEEAAAVLTPPRSRALDLAADQNILGKKLILHAGYFHNQFSHQPELRSAAPYTLSGTQAFRTQGFASELRYQPLSRLFLRGGYTYMASLVEQSTATNSLYGPVAGARPFRHPPHTGFFSIEYTGQALTASLQASLAGRSDDSTFTPTLILPNHNLDFGYTRMDASLTYALLRNLLAFTQLTNLLNNQHIGPIGYPGTPFTVRAGLKLRLGGE